MKKCKTCDKEWEGKTTHLDCYKCRGQKRKILCPKKCGNTMFRTSKMCKKCFSEIDQTLNNNPNWKNGKTRHSKGYVLIHCPDHPRNKNPYVFEHILVMEKYLGRLLTENEEIHHKNGVRDDNRISNLELWTVHHPRGQRVEDLIEWAQEIFDKYL